jgi:hypothetical protein
MTRMTPLEQEERLRRALRAAAESVEPAGDGLERIRGRLTRPRPLAVAWLMAGWTDVAHPAMLRIEPVWAKLAELLGQWVSPVGRLLYPAVDRMRPMLHRLRPTIPQHTAGSASQAPRYPWLRLAAAIGVIVVVAFVGGFVLTGLPHTIITQMQNMTSSGGSGSGGSGHAPTVTGSGTRAPTPGNGQHRHNTTPSPSASCSPAPSSKQGSSSPSPAPTNTPIQPSPTASPSPSVSPSPTPTPTPSSTSGSTSPSPTSGEISVTAVIVTDNILTGRPPQQASKPSPTPTPTSSPCSAATS